MLMGYPTTHRFNGYWFDVPGLTYQVELGSMGRPLSITDNANPPGVTDAQKAEAYLKAFGLWEYIRLDSYSC